MRLQRAVRAKLWKALKGMLRNLVYPVGDKDPSNAFKQGISGSYFCFKRLTPDATGDYRTK